MLQITANVKNWLELACIYSIGTSTELLATASITSILCIAICVGNQFDGNLEDHSVDFHLQ